LKAACQNLFRDRYLVPALMLRLEGGHYRVLDVEHLLETPMGKCAYLAAMRKSIEAQGRRIESALLLMDSWYVRPEDRAKTAHIRASQHPYRKTAIFLGGRNAAGTRRTFIVQPYEWKGDVLSIEKPAIAICNERNTDSRYSRGLIDALFE
jgi:hypothetical protein